MRTSIYVIVIASCLSVAAGCSKHKTSASNASSPIAYVTAYFKPDYINGNDSLLLRNKPVFVAIDTGNNLDSSNYFYFMPTGTDGNFAFYIPNDTLKYRVFAICYDTVSSAFIPRYFGSVIVSPPYTGANQFELMATIDTVYNNGMIIVSVDKDRNIVPRVTIILYTSPFISFQDSGYTGAGNWREVTTDSSGMAFVAGVPGDSVYESAKISISKTDSLIVFDSAIAVSHTGITMDSVILH